MPWTKLDVLHRVLLDELLKEFGIIGLTEVWHDTRNGKITEVDITFNDIDYQFSTDPRDTTGPGSGRGGDRVPACPPPLDRLSVKLLDVDHSRTHGG